MRLPSFARSSRYIDMNVEELNVKLNKFKVIDGSMLKIIAVITMLIDHIAVFVLPYTSLAGYVLFTFLGKSMGLIQFMRHIGRLAFPIYAFLITEGYIHTHDRKKYGRNLLIFALISEIPWNYAHTLSLTFKNQNVFFTLFVGYLGICLYEKLNEKRFLQIIAILGLFLFTLLIKSDYGMIGYALILTMYILRKNRLIMAIAGSAITKVPLISFPAFIAIGLYNGKRGFIKSKFLKYAFYIFYPVHLLVLGVIHKVYFS
ncbi:MAG: conjugal transfer protein TraX [Clostridia bacterium]|nr:conjugal transfer protein TraX [Clostridia bacterium]